MSFTDGITDTLLKYKKQIVEIIKRTLGPILIFFGFGTEHDWNEITELIVQASAALITFIGYADAIWEIVKKVVEAFVNIFNKIVSVFKK